MCTEEFQEMLIISRHIITTCCNRYMNGWANTAKGLCGKGKAYTRALKIYVIEGVSNVLRGLYMAKCAKVGEATQNIHAFIDQFVCNVLFFS